MTILEEKIRKNREQFNVHEPAEGHTDRFSDKLDKAFHQERSKRSVFFIVTRYAAGVLIIAAVAAVLLFQYSNNSSMATAGNRSDELQTMIDHYNMLAEQKLEKISACAPADEEGSRINAMAEQQLNSLDGDASELKEKLEKDDSNEKVYSALVENYRTRIKILDNIITTICQL